MRSFKKIVTVIVLVVLTLLSSSIAINVFYVNPIIDKLDDINNLLKEGNERYIEMDLPIRVIKNVRAQIFSERTLEEQRKQRILTAYNDNYEKLVSKLKVLAKLNQKSIEYTESLNKVPVIHFVLDFDNMIGDLQKLNEELIILSQTIDRLSYIEASEDRSLIDKVSISYVSIREMLDNITESYNNVQKEGIKKYIIFINIGFATLLIVIVMLAILLGRILGRDLKFVLRGFQMLNQYDYEEGHLPDLHTYFLEEKEMKDLVTEIFEEQKFLNQIKEIVSREYILDEILDSLFFSIQGVLKADRLGVAFIDYSTERIIAEHGVFNYGKVLLGPGFEVKFENTTLTRLIESKESAITRSIDDELKKRPDSHSLKLLKKEGIKSNMIIPLIVNDMVFGFLFFSSVKENNFDERSLQLGKNIAYEISAILDKAHLTKKMFSTITRTFADLVEKKDNETGDHINRMTCYSKILAEALMTHEDKKYRVTMGFVNDIENNAAIHDIGKVGIPDRILKKPGKLDADEWQIMKQHSSIGGDILMGLKESLRIFNKGFYQTAIEIARHHHERWDGTGYPGGLKGQEIPLAARIVAIADVFDAVSSKRVYKAAFGFEESVEIINQGAGSHFDPELVQVFNSILPKFRKIYELDQGKKKDNVTYEKKLG